MKTLYMVRHAKSSWKHDVEDHQRPLKGRGKKDGKLVSQSISKKMPSPQQIVSSDAKRALTTAKYFKKAFKVKDANFETKHDLYDFSGQNVMRIIKEFNNNKDVIMIVGHNHAFTSIANMLGNNYIDNLPTCGFVAIQFNTSKWSDITTGQTVVTLFPRDLK